jgi:PAS domain S-box-containing protein
MGLPPSQVDPSANVRRLEKSLADLRALSQVIVEISSSLDLDAVLRASRAGIQRLIHGDAGCFLLIQPGAPTLELAHAETLPAPLRDELQNLVLDPEIFADVSTAETRNSVIAKLGDRIKQILKHQSVESYVMMPLTAQTHAVGVVLITSGAGKVFEAPTLDLLLSLGERVGLAIENARLLASVKAAEEWRRDFMENSPDAFWEGDFEGRITYVNAATCRLFGYDRDALMQMRVTDLTVDAMESHKAASAELRQTGVLIGRDAKIITNSGEIRTVNYTSRAVRDQNGMVVRFQAISQDVTERRKLTEELSYRTEELTALNEIAKVLSRPLELEHSLDQVCKEIVSITGMEGAAIVLMDESKQFLYPIAHHGVSDNLIRQTQRLGLDNLLIRSIVEGDGLAIDDVMLFDEPDFEGPRAEGYRAGICMPIKMKGTPVGVLFVGSKVKEKYEPSDLDLLRNISSQIAVALENANLYTQMQRRVEELDGLAQLSAACTTTLDVQEVADLTIAWTRKLLPASFHALRLRDENRLRLVASRVDAGILLRDFLELEEAHRAVIENRNHYQIADLEMDETLSAAHRNELRQSGIRAYLAVPLPTPEQVIGILAVGHAQPHVWLDRELELLKTIANQTANVIRKAQLYQNVLNEQRKVQAIFDSGLSGLYATDAERRIVMFNRAAERITGWKSSEVEGMPWQELFGDPAPLYRKALDDKTSAFNLLGRALKTRDGREIPIAEAVAPLLNEKDDVIGAVGAFWDLTKEKQAEESRARFLQQVAHQLRTPLSSLLSALQLLERQGMSERKRAALWRIVKSEGTRLKEFSNRFLDLEAEIKSPRLLQWEALSIGALVRRVAHDFAIGKPEYHLHVKSPKPDPIVYADVWRVENILRNLLDNAASYSPESTQVTLFVQLLDNGMVDIAVQDQGDGIPFEDQEHIFKPFYRSSTSKGRRTYGHGLGLSIAKGMVEEMGGKIWVDSDSAQGATFHFTLRRNA